jgi:hypothetical protein
MKGKRRARRTEPVLGDTAEFVAADNKLIFGLERGAVFDSLVADRPLDRVGVIVQHNVEHRPLEREQEIGLLHVEMAFAKMMVGKIAAAHSVVPTECVTVQYESARRPRCQGVANMLACSILSAFAARQRLVLGQIKVADKSNEIVAIPKLLDMLAIEGAIVTIDAMGCQREIAQKIVDKKADYVLALTARTSRSSASSPAAPPHGFKLYFASISSCLP